MLKNFKNHLEYFGKKISNKKLLVFDYRSILLFLICALAFVFLVAFDINYSSIKQWDIVFPDEQGVTNNNEIIIGKPRAIRSDEYSVLTPAIVSQAMQDPKFPIENETIGAGKAPLLMSLPVRDISTFFRPQNWGFFVFNFEKAFSFYWNFKVLSLFLGVFILLMLLTRNNFWLSVLGSIWVFFSAFLQWWFSTYSPEMIASFTIIFVSAAYMFFSENKKEIALAGIAWIIFSINFIMFFYPPFQIPLIYLAIFIFIPFAIRNFSISEIKKFFLYRVLCLIIVVAIAGFFAIHTYHEIKDTVALVRNTEYPGIRFSPGGGMALDKFFSGFYGILLNENNVSVKFGNICEASSFFLFFPILILLLITDIWNKKKINPICVGLLAYIIFMGSWILFGFSNTLAKITLLSTAPPNRAMLGMGLASIFWTIIFFSGKNHQEERNKKISLLSAGLAFFFFFLLFTVLGYALGREFEQFFSTWQIIFTSLLFSALSTLILYKKSYYFFLLLLPILILPNFPVNPISRGLSSIQNKGIIQYAESINNQRKNTSWLVFGCTPLANLLKSSGVNVVDGVHYSPNLKEFKLLDPQGDNFKIYNRYAHIGFEILNDKNRIDFTLNAVDQYTVFINPCSDSIKKMGINFIVYSQNLIDNDFNCLRKVTEKPLNGMNVYRLQE